MRTLVQLRLKELDKEQPLYEAHVSLIANEARRREIRNLEDWKPALPEEVVRTQETNVKAGQYFRTTERKR